jgi:hypothetical protein
LETYISPEGSLPPGYTLDYEPTIFNTPAFLALQDSGDRVSFYLLDHVRKKAVASIHFHILHQRANSPAKAPFGSIEYSPTVKPMRLYLFLEEVESELKRKGIVEVFIKNPPRGYQSERLSMVESFLLNQKYEIANAEVSALIAVEDQPFSERIRNSERLRLRQGHAAGFSFQQLQSHQLSEVYGFLSDCHRTKGYHISITEKELLKSVTAFPEQYFFFGILHGSVVVAASVCIQLDGNVLYNFITNHEKKYNHLSPPVMLMEGTYEYCRRNRVRLFDLGTSALHGKPNFPLLDFKMHMGAGATSKFSFFKKIG